MIPESHPLFPVSRKVAAGERLDERDGLLLAASDDLPLLGWLAHTVRERMHGRKVFYNINRHINPTNVCYVGCELCAYADDPNAPGTWSYSPEECVEMARRDFMPGTSEFHIVGGLHPRWKFPVYLDILRALKQAFPEVHLKAFTMVEIDFLAKIGKLTVPETIAALREAGLDSCPGGGAEIFHPEIHDRIASRKMSGERWLEVAGLCHEAGLKTNCTMLFGHVEEPRHWVHHLLALREQQDRSGGFQCFIPLAFHPAGTKFADLPGPDPRPEAQGGRALAAAAGQHPPREGLLGHARARDRPARPAFRRRRPRRDDHRRADHPGRGRHGRKRHEPQRDRGFHPRRRAGAGASRHPLQRACRRRVESH